MFFLGVSLTVFDHRSLTVCASRSLKGDMSGEMTREIPGLEDPSSMQLVRSWQKYVESTKELSEARYSTDSHFPHMTCGTTQWSRFRQYSQCKAPTALYIAV